MVDTSKPMTPYLWYTETLLPTCYGPVHMNEVHLDLRLLNYNTIYKLDNCHCMTSNLRNACLLVIEGAIIIYVKHWLGLIRQSNLATLCCLPVKFPHHPSIHPPRASLIILSTHNYVPQFVPLPLAQVKNGDKQFWK